MSKIFEATERAKSDGVATVVAELSPPPVDPRQAAGLFEDEQAEVSNVIPIQASTAAAQPAARQATSTPDVAVRVEAFREESAHSQKLITAGQSPAAYTEYRRLAATLHQAQVEHDIHSVLVTSSMPGEGKSLTAANLALTLADVYRRRVVLVDADTRRPILHRLFGVANDVGLIECVRQGHVAPSAIVDVGNGLHLLPGGRPIADPVNELSSPRFREVLAQLAGSYDWIVVDTPPALLLPDTELIGPLVDGCLLVVQAGRTQYKKAQRVVETLGRERILGVILNRAEHDDLPGSEYGDYYYGSYSRTSGGDR